MKYPNPSDNPARQALTRAVNKAIAAGAPVYVNKPAPAPVTLARRVRAAVTTLNNHYGYGDVLKVKMFMNGNIHFTVRGYMMRPQLRRGHLDGNTVHVLKHQRAI